MEDVLKKQRAFFDFGVTKPVAFRKKMLRKLRDAIKANEELLYAALKSDLNKSRAEAYLTELQMTVGELDNAIKHLDRWQKPKRARTPITHFPASSRIYREPMGCVLILSPWNYPLQLALVPLIGAIAGGNCAVLKLSASSPDTSAAIKKLLGEAFDESYIHCADASHEQILAQKYDLIFFTGSEKVGKIVMAEAAKNLTPVILELGGKSPCIVEKTANVRLAAKRIAWGKLLNSGQTCVAPDYVLVCRPLKEAFLRELRANIGEMYGDALENESYPKIVNKRHFDRLKALVDGEKNKEGGRVDEQGLRIEPTLFVDASFDDPVMREEIFGPILPIICYDDLGAVIEQLKSRPKPLALYLFCEDSGCAKEVINSLSFGGGCINDVVMHIANHHLPFGGAGESGMGAYHGKRSFDAFTREKSVLKSYAFLDVPLRYMPFSDKKLEIIKKFTAG